MIISLSLPVTNRKIINYVQFLFAAIIAINMSFAYPTAALLLPTQKRKRKGGKIASTEIKILRVPVA